MTAKNDEYLMEATKTLYKLYNLNADDMVRQRCQARIGHRTSGTVSAEKD